MNEPAPLLSEHPADLVHALNDHFQHQASYISDKSDELRYHAENYIQVHPWRALALAGGIGLLLGIVLGRLSR